MGPEVAASGSPDGAKLATGRLHQELLSRATQQGAAALAVGRAGDAVKFLTAAAELAQAHAGATPEVMSRVLAQRSTAQLAANDPERALEDGIDALQRSATSEVCSAPERFRRPALRSLLCLQLAAGPAEHSLRAKCTARPRACASVLRRLVEARSGRVRPRSIATALRQCTSWCAR